MSSKKKVKPWESRWEEVRELDSGGQGRTVLVVQKGAALGTSEAVLKILHNNKDSERRSRMAREAAALEHLSHSQLPRFIESNARDYRSTDEPLYVVLEYIPGTTLGKQNDVRLLSMNESFSLVKSLLETIEYCHGRGVIHRDIKPDNIILRNNDPADPVLLDFGLSYGEAIHADATPTLSGQQLGNRFLHLPELQGVAGDKRDPRSDLTQCCGILFYLVTGIIPINLVDENNQQPHQRPNGVSALEERAAAHLQLLLEVFDTGFRLRIDERFQTAGEFQDLLNRANPRGLPQYEASRIEDGWEKDRRSDNVTSGQEAYDELSIPGASLEDLDPEMIASFRKLHTDVAEQVVDAGDTDEDLLYALHAVNRQDGRIVPTRAGLLIFGKRTVIRRYFPLMRVDYIRMDGREWVPDPENRGWHVEIVDSLFRAIPRAIQQIMDDIPRAFHLPLNRDQREEIPLLPRRALQELVVNAIMHRDYRLKSPIQIIRYADRLEIRNPGFSLVPDEQLGRPGSRTRNEKIAAILHDTRYAETKGTGIHAVRNLMKEHKLEPPVFESDTEADTFIVTVLFHHLLSEANLDWLRQFQEYQLSTEDQKALLIIRDVGFINSATYRDINSVDVATAQASLKHLANFGLVEERKQGSEIRYVRGRKMVRISAGAEHADLRVNHDEIVEGDVPPTLIEQAGAVTRTTPDQVIYDLILKICSIHPMTAEALGKLFGHTSRHMKNRYLRPLLANGELALLYPMSPHHPRQAYRTRTSAQPLDVER